MDTPSAAKLTKAPTIEQQAELINTVVALLNSPVVQAEVDMDNNSNLIYVRTDDDVEFHVYGIFDAWDVYRVVIEKVCV